MSFISYAQNYEDVLLWRALRTCRRLLHRRRRQRSELHSVTKAFYDAGWSGINIEPMPSYRAAFREQRPRDINLNVAAGASSGSITLFDVPDVNGWASTDATVAQPTAPKATPWSSTRAAAHAGGDLPPSMCAGRCTS
jgi:hypothetical protein